MGTPWYKGKKVIFYVGKKQKKREIWPFNPEAYPKPRLFFPFFAILGQDFIFLCQKVIFYVENFPVLNCHILCGDTITFSIINNYTNSVYKKKSYFTWEEEEKILP